MSLHETPGGPFRLLRQSGALLLQYEGYLPLTRPGPGLPQPAICREAKFLSTSWSCARRGWEETSDGAAAEGRVGRSPRVEIALAHSLANLVLLAGVPVLAGVWALLSPKLVVSHQMTWDFLYNLSGAWHLQHGHVAHVDFHEPVGQLNFVLTQLGFQLLGPTPFAFLVGVTIVATAVFVSALLATMRRLPLVPAALFVIFVSLLMLMPAGAGDCRTPTPSPCPTIVTAEVCFASWRLSCSCRRKIAATATGSTSPMRHWCSPRFSISR